MPALANHRHERFAQEIAKGTPQSAAYALAGFKRHASSAARLRTDANVHARIAELQGAAADKAVLTRSWVLERLMRNVERSMQAEAVKGQEGEATGEYQYDGSVANRGLELLGKELGMFVERTENLNINQDVSDEPASDKEWADKHVTAH